MCPPFRFAILPQGPLFHMPCKEIHATSQHHLVASHHALAMQSQSAVAATVAPPVLSPKGAALGLGFWSLPRQP